MNTREKGMLNQFEGDTSAIDRISHLPWDVLDDILGRLPIRAAVSTSLLSTQWRYRWVNLSKLLFEDLPRDFIENRSLLASLVYHVLSSHRGHIHTFKLITFDRPKFHDINSWVDFLARKGIRELSLEYVANINSCKVPPSIFSCQQLTHLHINNGLPLPPATFNGFQNLVSLHIHGNLTKISLLEILICKCPVLQRLSLIGFKNASVFRIQAPKLKYLGLEGVFGVIILENCTVLADIIFKISSDNEFVYVEHREQGISSDLVHYLGCLSSLKSLEFSGSLLNSSCFLKNLLVLNASFTPFKASNHLRVLKLDGIYLNHLRGIIVTIALLKFFSNLQELYISVKSKGCTTESSNFLDAQNRSSFSFNCYFNRLQIVKIFLPHMLPIATSDTGFSCWHSEMQLIKLVLTRSPILKTMTIVKHMLEVESESEFLRELLTIERAAAQVKIAYY